MFNQETGTLFLGFAKKRNCQNCNNVNIMSVKASYMKDGVLYIKATESLYFADVYIMCPTCEHQTRIPIGGSSWVNKDKEEGKKKIYTELESGKEYTKMWFDKLHPTRKEEYIEHLKVLRKEVANHSLIEYLTY